MDGYLKANFKSETKEFHDLSLDDCDFIPDDEVISCRIIGRKHVCPRCGSITHLQTEDPYCSDCNWDSLEDQSIYQMD